MKLETEHLCTTCFCHKQDKLTLRDQCAMAAVTGLLANTNHSQYDDLARAAYWHAEEMLQERAKCNDTPETI